MSRTGYAAVVIASLLAILAASGATAQQDPDQKTSTVCKPSVQAGVCRGTEGDDEIVGSKRANRIDALGGNDTINEERGITLYGRHPKGPADRDIIFGGEGNDTIHVFDADNLDLIDCGPGDEDFVLANGNERNFAYAHGCEIVPTVN